MPALAEKNVCTGCTACFAACRRGAVTMERDGFGFSYPMIDNEKCVECSLCERVCPVLKNETFTGEAKAYAAYIKDEDIRKKSSSGGVFTALCESVIADGGVVWGAAWDESFRVVHKRARTMDEVAAFRGAKYAQSELCDAFENIKNELRERKVLFSGTPCQTAGLRALVGEDDNLILVDFICHSVPSPLCWEEYVKYRSDKDNDGAFPVSVDLRSKETGWSRYSYSNLFEYEGSGRSCIKSAESPYMRLFGGEYVSRLSCGDCRFKGAARGSDVTLGDFWGIWNLYPELDDGGGVSCVLLHSQKGRELFSSLSGRLVTKEVTVEEVGRENPSLYRASAPSPERESVLAAIADGRMAKVIDGGLLDKKEEVKKPSLAGRVLLRLKRMLN